MKPLAALLPHIEWPSPLDAFLLQGLAFDSREVSPGDAFVAVVGTHHDGRQFVSDALNAGASVVLRQADQFAIASHGEAWVIDVPGLTAAELAEAWFDYPGRQLDITGVTGTNGKTSVCWFLRDALDALGQPTAMIGTLGAGTKGAEQPTHHTTPDAYTLNRCLFQCAEQRVEQVVMEVSSHALDQHRLGQVPIRAAVFTNLSRDHLDYHGDMNRYLAAKARLFQRQELQLAVLNMDDAASKTITTCLTDGVRCVTFGQHSSGVTVGCKAVDFHSKGMTLSLMIAGDSVPLSLPLFGEFNLSNMLAVAALLHGRGYANAAIKQALQAVTPVPGRMQPITAELAPTVLVDYAHTPDGLTHALAAVKQHFTGKVHCVVGCGGDRDSGKRPLMAAVAEKGCDVLTLTSDNPRSESPQAIIDQMVAGLVGGAEIKQFVDRRQAIEDAIHGASEDDVVLIAGKGHETTQTIMGRDLPFDDRVVAANALASRGALL